MPRRNSTSGSYSYSSSRGGIDWSRPYTSERSGRHQPRDYLRYSGRDSRYRLRDREYPDSAPRCRGRGADRLSRDVARLRSGGRIGGEGRRYDDDGSWSSDRGSSTSDYVSSSSDCGSSSSYSSLRRDSRGHGYEGSSRSRSGFSSSCSGSTRHAHDRHYEPSSRYRSGFSSSYSSSRRDPRDRGYEVSSRYTPAYSGSVRSPSSRHHRDRDFGLPSQSRSALHPTFSSLRRRHQSLAGYGDDNDFRRGRSSRGYDLSRRYGGDCDHDAGDDYDGLYEYDGGYGDYGGYGYGGGRGSEGPYRSRGVYMTETITPNGTHWSYGGYTTEIITPGVGSDGYGSSRVRGRYERSRAEIC